MKKEDISKFVDGVELIGGFNSDHIDCVYEKVCLDKLSNYHNC